MIDGLMPKVDDYGTDDILMITSFKVKTGGRNWLLRSQVKTTRTAAI